MMLVGFVGLGFAGYRSTRRSGRRLGSTSDDGAQGLGLWVQRVRPGRGQIFDETLCSS